MMRRQRVLARMHRTLGGTLCVMFVVWFTSGIVMTFAGFPALRAADSRAHAEPLDPANVRLSLAQVGERADLGASLADAETIELLTLLSRPVYRVTSPKGVRLIDAGDGRAVATLSDGAGAALARLWVAHPITAATHLEELDQWTPQQARALPLLRVQFADPEHTEVYVSLARGEVVQRTTRHSRLLAWCGAIPHWVYPIALRRHATAWRTSVVVLSTLGALACALGLVHGFGAARVRRQSASGRRLSVSPFQERSLRWHHTAGLLFGVTALTWVLSGLLSVHPFGAGTSGEPRASDARTLRGGPLDWRRFVRSPGEIIEGCKEAAHDSEVVEVNHVLVDRAPFAVCHDRSSATHVITADRAEPFASFVDRDALSRAARALGDGSAVTREDWLTDADDYYYATHFEPDLALPVLRTSFANGLTTYVDPRAGVVLRRMSRSAAVYRWLYHGLHSLDFPWLYRRRTAWHVVVVGSALGGTVLSLSAVAALLHRGRRARRLHVDRLQR